MESYVIKGEKKLRRGFTTGTCAAAAACGAAQALLSGGKEIPEEIRILTPKGIEARIPVEQAGLQGNSAFCQVKKDSGDDPDVTNGTLVCAKVSRGTASPGTGESFVVRIEGGVGIGRVTKPGLACKVGEAAINPVPRQMIRGEVEKTARKYGYTGLLEVEISIPEGEKLARKTFNPKLGIVGGISVLGTTGIVEPMSEQALIDTIKVEMNVAKAQGASYLVLTPGNYGENFLRESRFPESLTYVKCSNFIGDALSYAREQKLKGVLLVGHIGKLVKIAAGQMNTHSKYGDHRMETLAAHVEKIGGGEALARRLPECVTTEDAIAAIKKQGPDLETRLWNSLLSDIQKQMEQAAGPDLRVEALIYSNQYGYLGETPGTEDFFRKAMAKEEET